MRDDLLLTPRPAGKDAKAPSRRGTRISLLFLAALAVQQGLLGGAAARECTGATLRSLTMGAGGIDLVAHVTFEGGTHDGFVSPTEGFSLQVVDAEDPTQVYLDVAEPAARFTSKVRSTRYDGMGTFDGSIRLTRAGGQADTIVVKLSTDTAPALPVPIDASLRVFLAGGELCAKSCVSACTSPAAGELDCAASAHFIPFADYGFGQLDAGRSPLGGVASAICGVDVRPGGPRCDFLISEQCLMPYPSSVFLDNDPTTPTGKRIHYDLGSLPSNFVGTPIDPTDWNTLDGFGPGTMIEAIFPDTGFPVDRVASGLAFHTDVEPSLDSAHPTQLVRWTDGAPVVHFAELDESWGEVDNKAFIMRPAVRLEDDTRYIVAIRDLVDTLGNPIRPRAVFRVLRDKIPHPEVALACGQACADEIRPRRQKMNRMFRRLRKHGIATDDLVLAWDFHTASTEALTGWLVSMRDQAALLPTPTFTVTSQDTKNGAGFSSDIWVRIQGNFQAPIFMTKNMPGARINLVNGEVTLKEFGNVPYTIDIPRVAVDAAAAGSHPRPTQPARSSLFGHGLLGTREQIGALAPFAQGYNVVIAGVDMQGMSFPDVFGIVGALGNDLSTFHIVPERLHQGILNHLLLGRLLADPVNGFSSHAAFKLGTGGTSVLDTSQVFYAGGSQGGIFGGTIMAISEIFERGLLVVPATNYSTLLQRSADFAPFLPILTGTYTVPLDQIVLYPVIQQLWDRVDPHSYLPHLLPGTLSDPPFPHKVLLHMATYDCEVSNVATIIQTRSLGIPQTLPVRRSFFGIPEMAPPFDGSALVEIDPQRSGSRCHTPDTTDAGAACVDDMDCPGAGDPPARTQCASGIPPETNVAPPFNNGAHGSTANETTIKQIDAFLKTNGQIEHFCDGICDPE